jgi:hypothetical protein
MNDNFLNIQIDAQGYMCSRSWVVRLLLNSHLSDRPMQQSVFRPFLCAQMPIFKV